MPRYPAYAIAYSLSLCVMQRVQHQDSHATQEEWLGLA